jgi:hypothetical protein
MINRESTQEAAGSNAPSSSPIHVTFQGDDVEVVREGNQGWVPLKRVCEALGLDFSTQLLKLKSKEWATMGLIPTVAEDGKRRETACIHLDSLPMWLATIETKRVAPSVRPKLVEYQKHCAKVLRDAVFGPREPEVTPGGISLAVRFECVRDTLKNTRQDLHEALGMEPGSDPLEAIANTLEELEVAAFVVRSKDASPRAREAAASTIDSVRRRALVLSRRLH